MDGTGGRGSYAGLQEALEQLAVVVFNAVAVPRVSHQYTLVLVLVLVLTHIYETYRLTLIFNAVAVPRVSENGKHTLVLVLVSVLVFVLEPY